MLFPSSTPIITLVLCLAWMIVHAEKTAQQKMEDTFNLLPDESVNCKVLVVEFCLPGIYGFNVTTPPVHTRKQICKRYGQVSTFSTCTDPICSVREQYVLLQTACDFTTYDVLQETASKLTAICRDTLNHCVNTVPSFHKLFTVNEQYCAAMRDLAGQQCLRTNCTSAGDVTHLEVMENYSCAAVGTGLRVIPGLTSLVVPLTSVFVFIMSTHRLR